LHSSAPSEARGTPQRWSGQSQATQVPVAFELVQAGRYGVQLYSA
jgi:hypothetical protein